MIYIDKHLYHITHIDNLQGIIDSGGIVCKNDINEDKYTNIAFKNLQLRRASTHVPIYPNGTLHDYAPFFFCNKPPMLFTISRNNVEGAKNTQLSIIYFVTTIDKVLQSDRQFVFTDGHAIMAPLTDFYNNTHDLDKIDWTIIDASYWADTEDAPDKKRRKQAEFLIHKKATLKLFDTIACQNREISDMTIKTLENSNLNIDVIIKPDWYY